MRRDDIEPALVEICSAVLEHSVDATLARSSNPAWDSLQHPQVIFGIAGEFAIITTK
jgi:hypothetical protein